MDDFPFFFHRMLRMGIRGDSFTKQNVQRYTNKQFLLSAHHMYDLGMMRTGTYPKSPVGINLNSYNRVKIDDLIVNSNTVLKGKFFLCRNITAPFQMVSIMSIVDDPEGEKAVQLALYNYSNSPDLLQVLPVGIMLAIKDPWFKSSMDGGYIVRVEDPRNVIIVDAEKFETLFPGLKWQGSIPSNYEHLVPPIEKKTIIDHKIIGNKHFVNKNFKDALGAYSDGLKQKPDDPDLFSNRAATYINLGYFHRGLEDAEKVLHQNPTHLKAIYRKVKALSGLNRFQDGLKFLQDKISILGANENKKQFMDLQKKLNLLERQRITGDFDFSKLFLDCGIIYNHEGIAEYVGPVQVVEIPGMGRGMVATEDIRSGQLLVVSKAFAYYVFNEEESVIGSADRDFSRRVSVRELERIMEEKIEMEPEVEKSILELYSGPTDDNSTLLSTRKEGRYDDRSLLFNILRYNVYGGRVNTLSKGESSGKFENVSSMGLWLLPSFINHSCWDCNSIWTLFGDIIMVRAFKDISKGHQILISYTSSLDPYEMRAAVCNVYGFTCHCTLCELDRNDLESGRRDRGATRPLFQYPHPFKQHFAERASRLESLHVWPQNFNGSIIIDAVKNQHFNSEESKVILMESYKVLRESPLIAECAICAVHIVSFFLCIGDREQVTKWIPILKKDLLRVAGSVDIIRLVGKETLEIMELNGFYFFEDY